MFQSQIARPGEADIMYVDRVFTFDICSKLWVPRHPARGMRVYFQDDGYYAVVRFCKGGDGGGGQVLTFCMP